MKALTLIDILLDNGTKLEQCGRIATDEDLKVSLDHFGEKSAFICGGLEKSNTYFYVYLMPLDRWGAIIPADCVMADGEGQFVFLYKIQD